MEKLEKIVLFVPENTRESDFFFIQEQCNIFPEIEWRKKEEFNQFSYTPLYYLEWCPSNRQFSLNFLDLGTEKKQYQQVGLDFFKHLKSHGGNTLLKKAMKTLLKKKENLTVLDMCGGLGHDAIELNEFSKRTVTCERFLPVYLLLLSARRSHLLRIEEKINREESLNWFEQQLLQRISYERWHIKYVDSFNLLAKIEKEWPFNLVFFDPMFDPQFKKRKTKKEMNFLRLYTPSIESENKTSAISLGLLHRLLSLNCALLWKQPSQLESFKMFLKQVDRGEKALLKSIRGRYMTLKGKSHRLDLYY